MYAVLQIYYIFIHTSNIVSPLRSAGYATPKASWIPSREREGLSSIFPQISSFWHPTFPFIPLMIIPLSQPYQPLLTPTPTPGLLSSSTPSGLFVQSYHLLNAILTSSSYFLFWPHQSHTKTYPAVPCPLQICSLPSGCTPGPMATGGHAPEIDVLINLQQVRIIKIHLV